MNILKQYAKSNYRQFIRLQTDIHEAKRDGVDIPSFIKAHKDWSEMKKAGYLNKLNIGA